MSNTRYSLTNDSVAVGTTVGASAAIDYGDFNDGMVYIPNGSSITTLTWHTALSRDGTYLAAEDAASAAVTQTVAADQAHPIPAALRGARFIKMTANAAGTVGVTLKD